MTGKKQIKPTFIARPPIVTILGHVDHGKTTLLDTIRKTNVVAKEFGGITQHTGAYQIETPDKKKITFIDTPGHQAFGKMRSRGAQVCDIAILVVAANDGVMPQTIESINHILLAKIPCIVALNKIDLPDINTEKIKKQLTKNGLNLEEYGGEVPIVPISAKNNKGIDKLLEMIFLLAELNQVKEDNPGIFKGVVIESELSKHKGCIATIVTRSGSLVIGDEIVCEGEDFKVRALVDWNGKNLTNISPGGTAEVLGWKHVPAVGSMIYKKNETQISTPIVNTIVEKPNNQNPAEIPQNPATNIEEEKIKIILKSDTAGTLETLLNILKEKTTIQIVYSGVGQINESDIFLAKTTNSLVIGFHMIPQKQIAKQAETEKVIIKTYNIIYELVEDIDDVVEAIKTGNLVEIFGEARIVALFEINGQVIAGVKVISGRVAKGDKTKIVRGETEIARAHIKSLKHGKEDINTAQQGTEAGVLLSQKIDLLTGDSIIAIG